MKIYKIRSLPPDLSGKITWEVISGWGHIEKSTVHFQDAHVANCLAWVKAKEKGLIL